MSPQWSLTLILLIAGMQLQVSESSFGEEIAEKLFLKSYAQTYFELDESGKRLITFDIKFRNQTRTALCMIEQYVPGSPDFDRSQVKVFGPTGRVPFLETSLANQEPVVRNIDKTSTRFVVVFRGRQFETRDYVGQDQYDLSSPGLYRIELKIPVGDCSQLSNIDSENDSNPNWMLGHILIVGSIVVR